MRIVRRSLNSLAIIDFGHSAHTSTPQSRILVAISPTVHSSLNQATLSAKTGVQFSQSPTDCVAFSLINQTVASVLILAATRSRINAILGFEFGTQRIYVHRFNITPDSVFHLHAIARIFKSDPLNTVIVLSHNQWSCCWDRTRCSIWIDTGTARNIILLHLRTVCWMLWGA